MLGHMTTGIVRERESTHGRGTREDRSTINFGCIQVWTPSTGVADLAADCDNEPEGLDEGHALDVTDGASELDDANLRLLLIGADRDR